MANILNTEVDFERPELTAVLNKYQQIRDCLQGEAHIKSLGDRYLPIPGDTARDKVDLKRYNNYVTRANFLNATGLTQRTVIGKLFAKKPTIELPEAMKPLLDNVNGEGLAFDQLAEKCVAETFAFGRCGVYADFKNVIIDAVSIADTAELQPTITFCAAEDIINWRVDKYRKRLMMVVIREYYEQYEGFAVTVRPQYRVFNLDETLALTVSVWRERQPDIGSRGLRLVPNVDRFEVVEQYRPLLPGGKVWDKIPFALMGATDNDWSVDEAPLYQISTYDVSLYRNSADIEESAHLVGQPTPYVAGVSDQWAEDMKISELKMGSGRFIPLEDSSSSVGLVQASSDTMLDKLMEAKMQILRHLGATVFSVESLAQDQTATGAVFQALQIHAPLVTTSRNVVEALITAVGYAAMFVGIDPQDNDEINIKLNSDVLDNPLGVTGLQTMSQLYKDGLITFDEAREQVKVQGLSLHDDPDEARDIIAEEGLGSSDFNDDPQPLINEDMAVENELAPPTDNATN